MQAQSLSELSVECDSADILTLAEEQLSYEGMLSIENPDHDILKKPVVYHSHFTKKRKIIFLAKRYNYVYLQWRIQGWCLGCLGTTLGSKVDHRFQWTFVKTAWLGTSLRPRKLHLP